MRAEGDFFTAEQVPYTRDAWGDNDAAKIGYEISFMSHFDTPQRLRPLAQISADVFAVVKQAERLPDRLLMTDIAP
jgi:hypothetical protein